MKKRLFIDLDGTLAVYKKTATEDELYREGYFYNLPAQQNLIEAVKSLIRECSEWLEIYILGCFLPESAYALEEKANWCQEKLPEIPMSNYIFVPCGKCKEAYVPGTVRKDDVLLDDYTANLLAWSGKGVKCLNGINHTRKTWKGKKIDIHWTADVIAGKLKEACQAA